MRDWYLITTDHFQSEIGVANGLITDAGQPLLKFRGKTLREFKHWLHTVDGVMALLGNDLEVE